jgi:hypothetical protein
MKRKRHETDDPARMLSQRLNGAFRRAGEADWLDVRRRAGESDAPARWSRRRVLLVAAMIVFAVAACAGSTGVIPWLSRKPAVSIGPPLAPACKAKDLHAAIVGGLKYSTGDSRDGEIRLTNTSRRPCSLTELPRLVFTGAAARSVRVSIASPKQRGRVHEYDPMRMQGTASLRALSRGDAEVIGINWASWCGPGSRRNGGRESGAAPDGLAVILSDGNRVVMPLRIHNPPWTDDPVTPGCYGNPGSASLSITTFWVMRRSKLTVRLPLHATIPGVKFVNNKLVGPQYRVRQGAVLHYVVALTNTSKRPFRFHTCPPYYEEITSVALYSANASIHQRNATLPRAAYVLNCRRVGTIAPGATVRFAMKLPIPKNAYLGRSALRWVLTDPFEGELASTPFGKLIGVYAIVDVVK